MMSMQLLYQLNTDNIIASGLGKQISPLKVSGIICSRLFSNSSTMSSAIVIVMQVVYCVPLFSFTILLIEYLCPAPIFSSKSG